MAKNISRKDFLKGAAMSAAGVGLFASGLMNAAPKRKSRNTKIPATGCSRLRM